MEENMVDLSDVFEGSANLEQVSADLEGGETPDEAVMEDDLLEGAFAAEDRTEPSEDISGDTIVAKYLHREYPLDKKAVESIAEALGIDSVSVINTIQKGLNYDRLQYRLPEREPADENTQQWIDFFLEHREYEANTLPWEMLELVEAGMSPREAHLAMQVKSYERRVAEYERMEQMRIKHIGSMGTEAGKTVADPFESAFDQAFSNSY